jgi:UDP-glucose 4-epimerase
MNNDIVKNIVIGGSGFIGSELCARLNVDGESFLSISKSEKNITGFNSRICDVGNSEKLKNILKGAENIFILIGQTSSDFDKNREIENIKSTIDCIDDNSTKKVFYFSSALIYGEAKNALMENSRLRPVDEYSKFKVEAENVLKELSLNKKWKLGILRLSNVYGNPRNRGFIGFVLNQVLEKKLFEIPINGNGNQLRDYIFIDDVVDAVLSIRDKIKESDIINISSGESYSLLDVISEINKNLTRKIKYKILYNKIIEVNRSLVSNEKLRDSYGFIPKYDFSRGITRTIENYKNLHN